MGYAQAGFDVTGIDITPQPHYPFRFIQADALTFPFDGFDVVHASPPCQAYSICRNNGSGQTAPKLIEQVRDRIITAKKPYVIENVVGAPLIHLPLFHFSTITLCGAFFGLGIAGFDLSRHRLFESNVLLSQPPCLHRKGKTIGVYGGGTNTWHRYKLGRCLRASERRQAMGIDWMTWAELNQAIPPAYTKYIGQLL